MACLLAPDPLVGRVARQSRLALRRETWWVGGLGFLASRPRDGGLRKSIDIPGGPCAARSRRRTADPEEKLVPALGVFSNELSFDDVDSNLAQPNNIRCRVRLAPVHRRAVEVSDSGPGMVPDRRQKQAAGHQPPADPTEDLGLLL
jgi:hypothetical protein